MLVSVNIYNRPVLYIFEGVLTQINYVMIFAGLMNYVLIFNLYICFEEYLDLKEHFKEF